MTIQAIEEALQVHEALTTELINAQPSEELAARVNAAMDAGESIQLALRALQLRLTSESRRLTQIQTGLLAGLGCSPDPQIEYRG